jgi:hypothetical protein
LKSKVTSPPKAERLLATFGCEWNVEDGGVTTCESNYEIYGKIRVVERSEAFLVHSRTKAGNFAAYLAGAGGHAIQ